MANFYIMADLNIPSNININLIISEGEGTGQSIADIAAKYNVPVQNVIDQVAVGMQFEKEHSDKTEVQQQTVMNHLWELGLKYYDEQEGLPAMEARLKNENKTGLNKQHIKTINTLRSEVVNVFTVNRNYVNLHYYPDFTMGGHHYVGKEYEFIPDSEIWIDQDLDETGRAATIEHERIEYELMKFDDLPYEEAHEIALKGEIPILKKAEIYNSPIIDEFFNDVDQERQKKVEKQMMDQLKEVSENDTKIISDYPKLTKSRTTEIYHQVAKIVDSSKTKLSAEEKYALEMYEGLGSQITVGVIDKGLLHQFYTPYVICKKVYEIAEHYGVNLNSKINILEPAMGTGRFFKFAPKTANLFGFDPDATNFKIANLLYPNITAHQTEFETAFLEQPRLNKLLKKSWLPEMDLVVGNPPYGEYIGYYKSYMPKVFKRFEFLFVYLGLKTLKPGGLLIYVVSQNFMNNGAMYNGMKQEILKIGQFVDAFRLPNSIFSTTEVGTDIIIFKKR